MGERVFVAQPDTKTPHCADGSSAMTALDAIAEWLRAHRARPVHMAMVDLAEGTGDLRKAVANTVSVVLSLARVSTAQANMLRGLADENAALRARVDALEARPVPRRPGPFDGLGGLGGL